MTTVTMTLDRERHEPAELGQHQLRHDLLNRVHVLEGVTAALLQSELTDTQHGWVQVLRSAISQLSLSIDRISAPHARPVIDGRARLADLCSIAAAHVGKPFDRRQLVEAIEQVGGSGRSLRLLLVDDSPELVLLVRTYLDDTGWRLDVVENGEQAVAQATTTHYDIVLMDIDLPGLDGAAAAHAIRAADLARGTSPTPVIALTAFAFDAGH